MVRKHGSYQLKYTETANISQKYAEVRIEDGQRDKAYNKGYGHL